MLLRVKEDQDNAVRAEEKQRLLYQKRLRSAGSCFSLPARNRSVLTPTTNAYHGKPRRAMTAVARTSGFSSVDIHEDEEMENIFSPGGFNPDHKWSNKAMPVTNGRRPKRPQTSYQPRSRRVIRQTLLAEFQAKNAQGKTRSVSAVPDGPQGRIAIQISAEKVDGAVSKETNKLDKLQNLMTVTKRAQIMDIRSDQQSHEDIKLKTRIKTFCKEIEEFKKKTKGETKLQIQMHPLSSFSNLVI